MEWYQDSMRKTYVATYQSEKVMRVQMEVAAHYGFVSQGITRHGQEWTITFHRDERMWARLQVENVLLQLSQEQEKLRQTKAQIDQLHNMLQSAFRAARHETSNPTELEKKLLKSITDLIAARQAANAQRLLVLNVYASLSTLRAEAARLQVDVPQANINIEVESAPIRSESNEELKHLQREQSLQQTQQGILKVVQQWQQAIGDWWGATGKVAKTEGKVAAARTSSTLADAESSTADTSKTRAMETQLAKHHTRLETLETLVQQREADLLLHLEARDRDITTVLNV